MIEENLPSGGEIDQLAQRVTELESTQSTPLEKKPNKMATRSFCLGLISVFLWPVGILGIVYSTIGLRTFEPEKHKSRWMAWCGLGLSIIYTSEFAATILIAVVTYIGRNAQPNTAEPQTLPAVEKEALSQFARRHSSWLYEHDSNGDIIVDQRTGRLVFTPNGKRLFEYMDEARAKGIAPLPKTEILRRCPLWPEAVTAIIEALATRGSLAYGGTQSERALERFEEQVNYALRRLSADGVVVPQEGKP